MRPTTTDDVLKKMPNWKADAFNNLWEVGWRRNCSKKEAALVWDRVAETQDIAYLIINRARAYRGGLDGTAYLKGLAPWLNAAAWENVAEARPDTETDVVTRICQCGGDATRKIPEVMCDGCVAEKFSMQFWKGEMVPYKTALWENLRDNMGMDKRDGETKGEYSERCRAHFHNKAGAVGMVKGTRV